MKDIQHNQPPQAIRGGTSRSSILVNRAELPAVAIRERVVAVLLMHDLQAKNAALQQLDETDFEIIRVIAQEGAAANAEPALRYNAIAALAYGRSSKNLNLLADLAQFGEDFYVRGHALLALGTSGLHLAIGIIAAHLEAKERFEQIAANRAIASLALQSSVEAVRAHGMLLPDPALRMALDLWIMHWS